jgi:threonine dehydrogenase-like Zn-dependent dehydrogenase
LAIVTYEVLERGIVEPQDFIAVVGPGPIGLLAAFAAKAGGASKVAVLGTDKDAKRLEVAKQLGVDFVINTSRENAKEVIDALTAQKGADMVVEASGSEGGINTAVDIVKKSGRITAVGMPQKEKIAFKWLACIHKLVDIRFNLSSSYTSWDRALSMMANTWVDLGKLISHRESIENWEQVFSDLSEGNGVKAMFIPQQNR